MWRRMKREWSTRAPAIFVRALPDYLSIISETKLFQHGLRLWFRRFEFPFLIFIIMICRTRTINNAPRVSVTFQRRINREGGRNYYTAFNIRSNTRRNRKLNGSKVRFQIKIIRVRPIVKYWVERGKIRTTKPKLRWIAFTRYYTIIQISFANTEKIKFRT